MPATASDRLTLTTSNERFTKAERLRKRTEFKRVERRGKRRVGRSLIVYGRQNSLDCSRVGLTVSRKVGNAARRNRWKRRLRELFRRNKEQFPHGWDYVVIVRKDAAEPAFDVLRDELLMLMNEASALK